MMRHRLLRLAMVGVALAGGVVFAACDPCAGTPDCHTADRISYSGRVVEHGSNVGAPGTVVTFVRGSGVTLVNDTIRATADGDGFFRLTAEATGAGQVSGVMTVQPPNNPVYTTDTIAMRTTTVGGDGGDLGRFVTEPYIMFIAEVRSRVSGGTFPIPYPRVTFRRTGGIALDSDVVVKTGDVFGRFFLAPTAKQPGALQGTITLGSEAFARTYTLPVHITTRYLDTPPFDVTILQMGSSLLWAVALYQRGSNEPAANIDVDFQRTGGIIVDPSAFSAKTNAVGLVPIQPITAVDGELIGDVTVRPPAPLHTATYRGIRVQTRDDDSLRIAGRFGVGTQVFVGIAFTNRATNAPVAGIGSITFRRTGGIQTRPDTFVDRINQFGAARIQLATDGPGEVIGDVEVRLGAPFGTDTIRGVRLISAEDDIQRAVGPFPVGRVLPGTIPLDLRLPRTGRVTPRVAPPR